MVVGIDLGGMSAKAACFQGDTLQKIVRRETSAADSFEQIAVMLAQLAKEAAEASSVPYEQIEAIGVGAPGIVNSDRGIVVAWMNFGWKDAALKDLLSMLTGKPVFVLNDANAAALGEAEYGAGKGFSDSILITLGTGVGGGILLNGELFEGYKGAGAEIGHTVICKGGRKCSCGRRGCLETYVSTRALIQDTLAAARRNPQSKLNFILKEKGVADGHLIFEGLKCGDSCAKKVFNGYISALGEGVLNLVNLFRPQAVILGGGISAQGEILLTPLRNYVNERLMAAEYAPLEIFTAELGNEAGIYGAAEFARRKLGKPVHVIK